MQASPSLSDYGTALWRHKAIVGIVVPVGFSVGVGTLPHLASESEYQVASMQSFEGLPMAVLGQPTVTQPGCSPSSTLFTATGILLGLLIGVAIALTVDPLRPNST